MEGFGEVQTPRKSLFCLDGKAVAVRQKKILGGLATPGTLWVNLPLSKRPRKLCNEQEYHNGLARDA